MAADAIRAGVVTRSQEEGDLEGRGGGPGGAAELRRDDEGRTASGTTTRGWTAVSGWVVPVRLARERGAASLGLVGEQQAAVEDPGNLAEALAIRSGRKRLLA